MSTGPHQWWHHTVVCDFAGSNGPSEIQNMKSLVYNIVRMGFRAVALRPDDSLYDGDAAILRDLFSSLHRQGIKVIVRMPLDGAQLTGQGSLAHNDATIRRLRCAVEAGADGIDINVLDAPHGLRDSHEELNLTALIQSLQVELADVNPHAILIAESRCEDSQQVHHHIEEHWFHHLRDNALMYAGWSAASLRERVTAAFKQRDPLGHIAAWSWSMLQHRVHTEEPVTAVPAPCESWDKDDVYPRQGAMALFMLSLPGACYLPFALMGGRVVRSAGMWRRLWGAEKDSAAEARILRTALRLREERAMATGSFAWVDNLAWAGADVSVHVTAGMTVVLNTSDVDVIVPAEHHCVVFSAGEPSVDEDGTLLPPNTCAWFDTARIRPAAVSFDD